MRVQSIQTKNRSVKVYFRPGIRGMARDENQKAKNLNFRIKLIIFEILPMFFGFEGHSRSFIQNQRCSELNELEN